MVSEGLISINDGRKELSTANTLFLLYPDSGGVRSRDEAYRVG